MVAGGGDDVALSLIVGLVLDSERENRPLFQLIEEPYFFRRFLKRWILSGVEELQRAEKTRKDAVP